MPLWRSNPDPVHPGYTAEFGDVAEECEAYLAGRYTKWLRHEGLPRSPWTCLNRAAHGSFEVVLAHVGTRHLPEVPHTWAEAERAIEALTLGLTTPETFPAFQHEVLVPLELALLSANPEVSPRGLFTTVCAAVL